MEETRHTVPKRLLLMLIMFLLVATNISSVSATKNSYALGSRYDVASYEIAEAEKSAIILSTEVARWVSPHMIGTDLLRRKAIFF